MDNIEREIIELHQFFEDWMTGKLEQNQTNFTRVLDTMGENFYLVSPEGAIIDRATILDSVYNGYLSRPNFRMWIENTQIKHVLGDVVIATYEEWQEWKETGKVTSRVSTVIFTVDNTRSNGVVWQAVHETWLSENGS